MEHNIGEDIRLVPIDLGYTKAIFDGFDEDVIQFLPLDGVSGKIEDTKTFITHAMNQMKLGDDLVWVILYKDGFAGCCGIHNIVSKNPHFGLWIKTEAQGKGIGKKVVHHLLQWGITNLDVEYIKYPVDRRNAKSISLIKELDLEQADRYEMGNLKKLDVLEYRLYKK